MELSLTCRPQVARARRQARFVLQLANTGNLALDVELTAADADRAVSTSFTPARLRIEAGTVAVCVLRVRGPRMITGAELDRTVTVQAVAVAAGPLLAAGRGRPGGCTTPATTTTRTGWPTCARRHPARTRAAAERRPRRGAGTRSCRPPPSGCGSGRCCPAACSPRWCCWPSSGCGPRCSCSA